MNFSRRCIAGFVGGPFFYLFADVAVLGSENSNNMKSIVHTLSLKTTDIAPISHGPIKREPQKCLKQKCTHVYLMHGRSVLMYERAL